MNQITPSSCQVHVLNISLEIIVYSVFGIGRTIEVFVHFLLFSKTFSHEHDITISTLHITILWYCIPYSGVFTISITGNSIRVYLYMSLYLWCFLTLTPIPDSHYSSTLSITIGLQYAENVYVCIFCSGRLI